MRQEFESRRNFMIYKLNGMPHVSCNKPDGAFYAFANFSWYYDKQFEDVPIRNSAGLAYYLLKHAHVALIPGEAFGDDKFIRFSYSTSQDNLARALDRVVDALAKLKPTVKAKKQAMKIAFTKIMDYSELEAAVSIDKRDELVAEAESVLTYDKYSEWCANIGGVVLKFGTNSPHLIDFWMENWYPSPLESDLEPHGLLYSVKDAPGREPRAFYNSQTRTGLTFNTAYYPQLRAMTLGMVDDVASRTFDMHLIAVYLTHIHGSDRRDRFVPRVRSDGDDREHDRRAIGRQRLQRGDAREQAGVGLATERVEIDSDAREGWDHAHRAADAHGAGFFQEVPTVVAGRWFRLHGCYGLGAFLRIHGQGMKSQRRAQTRRRERSDPTRVEPPLRKTSCLLMRSAVSPSPHG